MPQVYNLGGLILQRLAFLNLDRLKDSSGDFSIMEITYNPSALNLKPYQQRPPSSVLWRNVEKIIAKNGNIYYADNIQESGNQVSVP